MNIKQKLMAVVLVLAAIGTGSAQPFITQQPQACTNAVGTTATFWVTATGTEPLAYQWQKLGGTWADLAGCMDTNLVLANIQTNHSGDYRVVITNFEGAVTSGVARLTVVTLPRIIPTATLQHAAVFLGSNLSFSVSASGFALAYQWQRDGNDLVGKTKSILAFTNAQPADEGDYSVVISNLAGTITSVPARLWVVPPSTELIRGDFTNNAGLRLPYFYWVPTNYVPTRSYWLMCSFHGGGDYVGSFVSSTTTSWPGRLLGACYKQQAADPGILVFPTRWWGGEDWTPQYLQLVSGLLDRLISEFNIDTNRVSVGGGSQGVHGVWDLMAMRPGFFAAAMLASGWAGDAPPVAIKDVPTWVFCAADDATAGVQGSRTLVTALRRVGGNPIYTEYNTGGHVGGIAQGICTPAANAWLLAQRRGMNSTNEPLLTIASPTRQPFLTTGTTNLSLAGSSAALGQRVTLVSWTNLANSAKGIASGTNDWSVTGIPIVAYRTNIIIVTATTTSWAPAYGGSTTFNDTLTIFQLPLRASLVLQGSTAILTWTGGGPPYRVQRATDLIPGDWTDYLIDAVPPVPLSVEGQAGFYRVVGQ